MTNPKQKNAADVNADWRVYIVECADTTLYTGVARNVTARIKVHNSGNGAKYTRGRLPVKLLYQEPCANRSIAQQREAEIKALSRADKLAMVSVARAKT